MKRIIVIFAALLIIASSAVSQVTWNVDKNHTEIQFKVKHMVITTVTGRFKDYDIKFSSNRIDNFSNAKLETTIRTESIFTDNENRDEHLRSEDFLNVSEHPEIRFVSKMFRKISGNMYKIVGDLTIKDVTKEVELDGELSGPVKARGSTLVAFHVTGSINRFDFGVQFNALLETGGLVVSDTVNFDFNLEFGIESN